MTLAAWQRPRPQPRSLASGRGAGSVSSRKRARAGSASSRACLDPIADLVTIEAPLAANLHRRDGSLLEHLVERLRGHPQQSGYLLDGHQVLEHGFLLARTDDGAHALSGQA